jgi:DNA gyrase/topoisomerase IV subunit A
MRQVACLSENGRLLVFPLDELKRLPTGGKGVILMGLDPKEFMRSAIAVVLMVRVTLDLAALANQPIRISMPNR